MQAARGGSSESVYRLDCLTNGGVKAKQQEKLKWEGHLALSIKQGVGLLWQQSWGAHWAAVFHDSTPALCAYVAGGILYLFVPSKARLLWKDILGYLFEHAYFLLVLH